MPLLQPTYLLRADRGTQPDQTETMVRFDIPGTPTEVCVQHPRRNYGGRGVVWIGALHSSAVLLSVLAVRQPGR